MAIQHTNAPTSTDSSLCPTPFAELHTAAEHLRRSITQIARAEPANCGRVVGARAAQQEELAGIYDIALGGWYEAPESGLTDDWLRRIIHDVRLPMESRRAAAITIAAKQTHDAVIAVALGAHEGSVADTSACLARTALYVLGPGALRAMHATVHSGGHVQRLSEISADALRAGELVQAVAALVIPIADCGLRSALTPIPGVRSAWRGFPDDLVAAQRCRDHDVFCCLQCPGGPEFKAGELLWVHQPGSRARASAIVLQRRLPWRTTLQDLATDLRLDDAQFSLMLRAVGDVTVRTRVRKLDVKQAVTLASMICDLPSDLESGPTPPPPGGTVSRLWPEAERCTT